MTLDTTIRDDHTLAATHRAMWALGDYALMAEEVMAPLGPVHDAGNLAAPMRGHLLHDLTPVCGQLRHQLTAGAGVCGLPRSSGCARSPGCGWVRRLECSSTISTFCGAPSPRVGRCSALAAARRTRHPMRRRYSTRQARLAVCGPSVR